MSESNTGPSYVATSDINAEVLRFSIEIATEVPGLRKSYTDNAAGYRFNESTKQAIISLAKTATDKLWHLGLDMDNVSDERIAGYHRSLELIEESDYYGLDSWQTTNQPHTVWLSSYSRILSALDPASTYDLRLLPQSELVTASLMGGLATSSFAFTAGDKYTHGNASYGRKAGRTITDPLSPFWGYGIHTDDCPGREFGRDGCGPNVTAWMPTGLIKNSSVLALKQFEYQKNDNWRDTFAGGYVPEKINVQQLRMGVPDVTADQVDTTAGHVTRFLEAARTL